MPIYNSPVVRDGSGKAVSAPEALAKFGPSIQILVSAPSVVNKKLSEEGKEIIKAAECRAQIDTGCTMTSVDRGVIKKLGVPQVGTVRGCHPNGVSHLLTYAVSLEILAMSGTRKWETAVVSVNLEGQPHDALIGWDVLRHCVLIMNGPMGCFTLAC